MVSYNDSAVNIQKLHSSFSDTYCMGCMSEVICCSMQSTRNVLDCLFLQDWLATLGLSLPLVTEEHDDDIDPSCHGNLECTSYQVGP